MVPERHGRVLWCLRGTVGSYGDYLKRKAVSCADNGLWQWYKYFRNKVTYTIRYVKKKYYDTKIAQSQSNPKQLWKVIGQLTGGQNRVEIPHDLTANDLNNLL